MASRSRQLPREERRRQNLGDERMRHEINAVVARVMATAGDGAEQATEGIAKTPHSPAGKPSRQAAEHCTPTNGPQTLGVGRS